MGSSSTNKEVARELLPILRVYKDGSVERLLGAPIVPPSKEYPQIGSVSSKDITISDNPTISARLYLPEVTDSKKKLPILVYFHGGGFLFESAFSFLHHRFLSHIVAKAKVVAVSVEYRLAPEHPLPAGYEDCWDALQWVALKKDSWLVDRGDFDRLFIGGDSAGGNIVNNMAIRAGAEDLPNGVKILGAFMTHPFFWSSQDAKILPYLAWQFAYPDAPGGIDNPLINPCGPGAPSLAGIGCSRMLVCVSEKDELRDKGVEYFEKVRGSGWKGEVELFEVKGEGHAYHIDHYEKESVNIMITRLASFLNS